MDVIDLRRLDVVAQDNIFWSLEIGHCLVVIFFIIVVIAAGVEAGVNGHNEERQPQPKHDGRYHRGVRLGTGHGSALSLVTEAELAQEGIHHLLLLALLGLHELGVGGTDIGQAIGALGRHGCIASVEHIPQAIVGSAAKHEAGGRANVLDGGRA